MQNTIYEYLVDNVGKEYPFEAPYSDLLLNQLIVDAAISTTHPTDEDASVVLNRLSVSTSAIVRIIITNGNGDVLLDSNDSNVRTAAPVWTGRYRTYEYYNSVNEVGLKIVIDSSVLSQFSPTVDWTAIGLKFVTRTITPKSEKVNSLYINTGNPADEFVELKGGYNTKLSQVAEQTGVPTDSIKPVSKIQIDVVPGYGFGQYNTSQNCDEISYVRKLNNVGPDVHGNVIIESTDCAWTTVNSSDNALEFSDYCKPCYTCDEVVGGYSKLKKVYDRAVTIRQDLIAFLGGPYATALSKVAQLKAALAATKSTVFVNQTDFEAFDVLVRVQAGTSTITKVVLTFSYTSDDPDQHIVASLTPFSAAQKLPGFAPQAIVSGFSITSYTYDTAPGPTRMIPNTWTYFYWNVTVKRSDYLSADENTPITVDYTVDLSTSGGTLTHTGSAQLTINSKASS